MLKTLMLKSFATGAAVVAVLGGLGGPVLAGPADTLAALNACAASFPDQGRIGAGLKAAGLADQGNIGGVQMFLSADGTTLAGTKATTATGLRCLVMENKLSVRKAEALAGALLKQMPGATRVTPPSKDISLLYSGMLNNTLSHVFVVKSFQYGKIGGATLLVEKQ